MFKKESRKNNLLKRDRELNTQDSEEADEEIERVMDFSNLDENDDRDELLHSETYNQQISQNPSLFDVDLDEIKEQFKESISQTGDILRKEFHKFSKSFKKGIKQISEKIEENVSNLRENLPEITSIKEPKGKKIRMEDFSESITKQLKYSNNNEKKIPKGDDKQFPFELEKITISTDLESQNKQNKSAGKEYEIKEKERMLSSQKNALDFLQHISQAMETGQELTQPETYRTKQEIREDLRAEEEKKEVELTRNTFNYWITQLIAVFRKSMEYKEDFYKKLNSNQNREIIQSYSNNLLTFKQDLHKKIEISEILGQMGIFHKLIIRIINRIEMICLLAKEKFSKNPDFRWSALRKNLNIDEILASVNEIREIESYIIKNY